MCLMCFSIPGEISVYVFPMFRFLMVLLLVLHRKKLIFPIFDYFR